MNRGMLNIMRTTDPYGNSTRVLELDAIEFESQVVDDLKQIIFSKTQSYRL